MVFFIEKETVMAMDQNRAAEIALLLQWRRYRVLGPVIYRVDFYTAARELGIPEEEMLEFIHNIENEAAAKKDR